MLSCRTEQRTKSVIVPVKKICSSYSMNSVIKLLTERNKETTVFVQMTVGHSSLTYHDNKVDNIICEHNV